MRRRRDAPSVGTRILTFACSKDRNSLAGPFALMDYDSAFTDSIGNSLIGINRDAESCLLELFLSSERVQSTWAGMFPIG
jgi:hypothetical protein